MKIVIQAQGTLAIYEQIVNKNEKDLRDNYDAVFHLVTAAKGAEEFYTLSNNTARTETVEEAMNLEVGGTTIENLIVDMSRQKKEPMKLKIDQFLHIYHHAHGDDVGNHGGQVGGDIIFLKPVAQSIEESEHQRSQVGFDGIGAAEDHTGEGHIAPGIAHALGEHGLVAQSQLSQSEAAVGHTGNRSDGSDSIHA